MTGICLSVFALIRNSILSVHPEHHTWQPLWPLRPTTNYAYMFPRKNYKFVGKIKVIASPEAKASLCLWLEAPGEELSSFWITVTEPSPSHKGTNNQFVNTAVKSWLNLEIN